MFVSYAQNFEDIMLWRAFKNIEKGFYIDIGAQDPVIDSVSLAFYEQGWRGVHVEPVFYYAEKLRNARPDETVIQAAVGSGGGEQSFFEIDDTGLSTGNVQMAERHAKEGFAVRETVVPCISLGDILDRYQDRDIHWLKIDVEGMEAEVVRGWQSSAVRPWIVVVESTLPNTQIETFADWEPSVLSLGYDFVYFDGLSRFYISQNHQELKSYFNSPPNVFDGVALSGTGGGSFCSLLNNKRDQVERELLARQEELDVLNGHAHHLRKELQAVYASRSWRITAPLRFINRLACWVVNGARAWLTLKPDSRPRRIARAVVSDSRSLRWFNLQRKRLQQEGLRSRVKALLKKIIWRGAKAIEARPGLKQRIVSWAHRLGIYPVLRRLYFRIARQMVSPLTEESACHSPVGTVLGEGVTPWARILMSRLEAARSGVKRGTR